MKLRIISGELKGRYVVAREGIDIRPTQERVRESVAEIVKRRVLGAAVADLCAGSGAFGFEMASRGAASVDFVEVDKRVAVNIRENAEALGVADRVRVVRDDVRKFVSGRLLKFGGGGDCIIAGDGGGNVVFGDNHNNIIGNDVCQAGRDGYRRKITGGGTDRYDIIYYDPPYDFADLRELVPDLLPLLRDNGLLIYERRRRSREKKAAEAGGRGNLIDARIYADTVIEIYSNPSGERDADSALSGDV
jgi:16S rRNA G966 N2-methylase RsmD